MNRNRHSQDVPVWREAFRRLLKRMAWYRMVFTLLCVSPYAGLAVIWVNPANVDGVSALGTDGNPVVLHAWISAVSHGRKCEFSVPWMSGRFAHLQYNQYGDLKEYDVEISVDFNPTLFSRSGVVTVYDYHDGDWIPDSVTITQDGAAVDISSSETSYGIKGGNGILDVAVAEGVQWTIDAPSWIRVQNENVGPKRLFFSVDANRSSISRSGTMTVGDKHIEVVQSGPLSYNGEEKSVLGAVAISYGSFDGDEVALQINGEPVLSDAVDQWGMYLWQPQKIGSYELCHITGTNVWHRTITIKELAFESVKPPSSPMSEDSNISITPKTAEFEKEGGYYAITTSGSSSTWTAAVSDPWIVLNATSGQVGKGCAYTVTASTNVETRTGYVYVSGHVHTVVQAGHGATLSKNNVEVECDGGTGTIDITVPGKYGWNARANVDWLSVTPTRGVGSGSVTYQVAPWHEVSTRSGTLTVGGNTFTVFQYGKRMKLSTYKVSQNYEAHVIPVTVDALAITKWGVTPNASWISIVDAGSGQGGDDVGIAIAENPSYKARTGTVTIGTETLTIVQEGRTALSFSIDPEETTADVYGANGLVAVLATPDLPWTAVSQSNWLTVYTKFKAGTGNGNIAYTVSPNPTLYDRTGNIKVTPEAASGVAAKTHTVTQPAALSSISLTSYEFAAAGENCAVEVVVDDIVEWQVENPVSWLTVVGDTTRVGPATITIQAAENTTVYPRSCTMTIARKTFTVRQLGRGVRVDTDSFVFGTKSSGSSFTVSPDGNVSWRPVASDDSWIIILDDEERTGSSEVQFAVTQYNGAGEARTGTITVGDKVVYITQRAFDLSINPTGAWVTGNAGAGEIGVSAPIGAVWEAIVTAPWIKVISGYDSGTGSGTVRYTYEDNDTGKTRSGKIVISGTAYVLEQAARIMVNVKATAGHGGAVEGGGTYSLGTVVTLRAVPSDGYVFAYWEGDVSSMQNPIEVTADVAKSVKAVFTPLTPEFVSVSNSTEGVTLVWSNMAWATEYNLYRAPSQSKSGEPLATIVADGTHEYFDASGEVGVPYWYWVEAVGAADTNECVNAVSGKKLKPIVISSISYTNLRGATHSNPSTYQEGTVTAFTLPQGGPVGYTFAG